MTPLRCLIVDDEPLAREGLAGYARQVEFLELKGLCKNALEANAILRQEPVDLIFLDIQMPRLSGLDWLRTLSRPPAIIFSTAYPQYALEGFQFDAVDYLLKPIAFDQFLRAANKAMHRLGITAGRRDEGRHIFVKTEKQLLRVELGDILCLEAMQNYVVFHTEKEKIVVLSPLKNALELLPAGEFLQVHKSFVVAREKVAAIEGNSLVLSNQLRVPISLRQRSEVVDSLTKGKVLRK